MCEPETRPAVPRAARVGAGVLRRVAGLVPVLALLAIVAIALVPAERAEAQSVPNVWWDTLTNTAIEPSELTQSLRFQVNQNLAAPLTVSYTIGGTATCGTDYTIAGADCAQGTGTFTIPGGTARFTNVHFPVTILGDAVPDTGETVILSINDGAG